MSNIILWAVITLIWIVCDIIHYNTERPSFWTCWYFFFTGMATTMLVKAIIGQ